MHQIKESRWRSSRGGSANREYVNLAITGQQYHYDCDNQRRLLRRRSQQANQMHKLSSFREIQAKGSAIYRDRSNLETHEKGICEFVHPRHTHDRFISLFIAEKLTLYYEYELAQARQLTRSSHGPLFCDSNVNGVAFSPAAIEELGQLLVGRR